MSIRLIARIAASARRTRLPERRPSGSRTSISQDEFVSTVSYPRCAAAWTPDAAPILPATEALLSDPMTL